MRERRSERARTATIYPDYYNSNCLGQAAGGLGTLLQIFFLFSDSELEFDVKLDLPTGRN